MFRKKEIVRELDSIGLNSELHTISKKLNKSEARSFKKYNRQGR